ncbi:MAG TPA: indolepyruvate oxidoreductase subunit beta [Bacillota bacterium]|nr:indolepyruvate oxidoreductase subunit beta [Bacillota bacterium]HOR86079.1 indolepyruvate oxidoreductase subunit beta [Bacillota bacterium]HPL54108.1 indolepyruvate oxidoreductase subunit beta [Bacillota bacterium]
MSDVKNILLVGVGGQGTILVSRILTEGLIQAGFDVKMSEVHGMAQRGGSVTTQVRYGKKVYSPIIGKGQADILVSFEKMEAVRWIEYLKPDGIVVVNNYEIPSLPIASGKEEYPQGLIEALQGSFKTVVVDAGTIAEELGNIKTQNIVLFGALVKALGLDEIDWVKIIRETIKPKLVDINIKAYNKGRDI